MSYIRDLALYPDGSARYRIVGTQEMVETEKYLISVIERLKEEVTRATGNTHQIEVWHQVGIPLIYHLITLLTDTSSCRLEMAPTLCVLRTGHSISFAAFADLS